ncbi:MAG: excinuclease ABC subunit UvrC [Clostridiales bacterium]|nr:excinuclease ABC subunit UvrC [Clostridiales bacterium]
MNERLKRKIKTLPVSPGCYLMKQEGTIIYVGKAIHLKNRVRSYFQKGSSHTPKVAAMVEKIDDFDIILCDTNLEALVLESNLIKEHQPYYNILLKDDKQYPYIKIDINEIFPKLEIVRKMSRKEGVKYFGPYMGATSVREVMNAVGDFFPLRNCGLKLPLKRKIRPCINYEIGRCLGPCAQKCTQEEYGKVVDQALQFLQGKYKEVASALSHQMEMAAFQLQYEKAAVLRDRMKDMEKMMEQQQAIQTKGDDQDIFAIAQDGLDAMAQVLWVRGGKMLGGEHSVLKGEGAEPVEEVMAGFLSQYYKTDDPIPKYVFCHALTQEDRQGMEEYLSYLRKGKVHVLVPQKGEKKRLVALAEKNALDALHKRNAKAIVAYERTIGASEELAEVLGLDHTPKRIEGFDISNTQGLLSVASMVVFVDGKPLKTQYRHFRIKSVEGANDFASMKEVVSRRLIHGLQEKAEREQEGQSLQEGRFSWLPDVILIDGGAQQLRFALEAMEEAGADIPMFALAEELDEIYLPRRKEPISLPKNSPALHLIQRIRDEAHRFAITHHRGLRGKSSIQSRLEEIEGIGPARRKALLLHFKSIQNIQEATIEELESVQGMNKLVAQRVFQWGRKNEGKSKE